SSFSEPLQSHKLAPSTTTLRFASTSMIRLSITGSTLIAETAGLSAGAAEPEPEPAALPEPLFSTTIAAALLEPAVSFLSLESAPSFCEQATAAMTTTPATSLFIWRASYRSARTTEEERHRNLVTGH